MRLPLPPARLPGAPGWAMFLDLDGTLCPYRADPAEVQLDGEQRTRLAHLSLRLDGALCVLSGRSAADLDRALGTLPVFRCGEHGHGTGATLPGETRRSLRDAGQAMRALASLYEGDGVWVEHKLASCALHYRRAPQHEQRLLEAMQSMAQAFPLLRLLPGQCVIELASRQADKGQALRGVMRNAPFLGRVPVAVGDDRTDEDAFVAAQALGGFGVCVGRRMSAAARYWLADHGAVHRWLQALAAGDEERHG